MISVNNISVSFSGIDLFRNVSFLINPRDRIGLVGKNGAGKSTLMKVITGNVQPDSGTVTMSSSDTVAYLPQEIKFESDRTVMDELLTVFSEINTLNNDIEKINAELEGRSDYESDGYHKLVHQLTEKYERLAILETENKEGAAEKILTGLGFERTDFLRNINEFSSGWQMRVELAKLLLQMPSLLLLDEPTNHLDIEAIIWLEEFLKNYPGAVMLISHDKMFLDNVTNRTIEVVMGRIYDYKVSYSKYVVLREERIDQQKRAKKNQDDYIRQQERFIERFRYKNTKSKQVQSKIKQLEKLDRIELDIMDSSSINFRFPPAPRSNLVVLKARNVNKSYGDKNVLNAVNLEVHRGEKIALVGKNGLGKSTFLKLFCENEPYEGDIAIGNNVVINYYAQVQERTMDGELTVLQTLEQVAKDEWSSISKLRGLLGAFLFREDDIDKKVKVLSGGEKSRLALAKMLLKTSNFLVLDEPTNHLDMDSKERLKQALMQYDGTMLVVSHDRQFLSGLTSKTFEFTPGGIREHLGPIEDFLRKHHVEEFRAFESTKKPDKKPKAASESPKKNNYQERKERDRKIRKLKKDINLLERKINDAENSIKALETKLSDPTFVSDAEASKDVFFEHGEMTRKLENYMLRWERLAEELDNLESASAG